MHEGQWTLEQLLIADEAFLTNSLMELMPMTQIDSACINNGKPGEMTLKLMALYKRQVEMDC
jgi:branched-subunit amino acid aminotransferase/4-amino-4-deoxychorismate lyase